MEGRYMISPRKLIQTWVELYESTDNFLDSTTKKSLDDFWRKPVKWSKEKFISQNCKSDSQNIFANKLESYFNLKTCAYWNYFDLIAYYGDSFKELEDFDDSREYKSFDYPKTIELIVKHEVNADLTLNHLFHLVHEKAKIKMLITYAYELYTIKNLFSCFRSIIKQANQQFQENIKTRYILFVGEFFENTLRWQFFVFDINGKSVLGN